MLGFRAGWQVAQELPYPTYEAFNEALRFDLERGQTAVNLILDRATQAGLDPDQARVGEVGADGTSIASVVGLAKALDGVDLARAPILVQPGSAALPFAALLVALMRRRGQDPGAARGLDRHGPAVRPRRPRLAAGVDREGLRGAGAAHPLGGGARAAGQDGLGVLASRTTTPAPRGARAGLRAGDGGRAPAPARARAASTSRRWRPRILFGFSVGSHFFMEIAKLRAARVLWARVVEACGGSEAAARMTMHARTSAWNKTKFDPHVNILRATTEAFAAVVGGCDSLHVAAFDEALGLPSELGRRIARNTQTILREEVHLDAMIDPAGGSWYVEKLTAEVAEKAWALLPADRGGGRHAGGPGEGDPAAHGGRGGRAAAPGRGDAARRDRRRQPVPQRAGAAPEGRRPGLRGPARRRSSPCGPALQRGGRGTVKVLETLQPSWTPRRGYLRGPRRRGRRRGHHRGVHPRGAGDGARPIVSRCRPTAPPSSSRTCAPRCSRGGAGDGPQVHVATVGAVAEFMPRLDFTRGFFQVGGFEVACRPDVRRGAEAT